MNNGYGINLDHPFSNHKTFAASKSNIAWKYEFMSYSTRPGQFIFDFGNDFGWGSATFFNGKWLQNDKSDQWWGYNWNHGDVMRVNVWAMNEATVLVYGGEGCCDGNMDVKIRGNAILENGAPSCDENENCESDQFWSASKNAC